MLSLKAFLFPVTALTAYFILSIFVFDFGKNIPIHGRNLDTSITYYTSAISGMWIYSLSSYFGVKLGTKKRQFVASQTRPKKIKKDMFVTANYVDIMLMIIALATAIIVFSQVDLNHLLYRDSPFIDGVSKRSMGLIDTLFWLALILSFYTRNFFLVVLSIFLITFSFVGMGQRQGFLLLCAFSLYRLFSTESRNKFIYSLLIILSVYLLFFIVGSRVVWIGGILRLFDPELISNLVHAIPFTLNYMSNFSIVTNAKAMYQIASDLDYTIYCLSPLPSTILSAGFDSTKFNLQPHVPYPAVATLFNNFGFLGVAIIIFIVYYFLALSTRLLRYEWLPLNLFIYLHFLINFMFGLQYNLRGTSRVFYFLAFLILLLSIYRSVTYKRKHGAIT